MSLLCQAVVYVNRSYSYRSIDFLCQDILSSSVVVYLVVVGLA
jgi:hypothetical protein